MKEIPQTLAVWKTIEIGGLTPQGILDQIGKTDPSSPLSKPKQIGEVGPHSIMTILHNTSFVVSPKKIKMDLALRSVEEFGFTTQPSTDEFMTKSFFELWSRTYLKGCAIQLCPAEVGPQLRWQYPDQPRGEVVSVAMDRIEIVVNVGHKENRPTIFSLKNDKHQGRRWLNSRVTFNQDKWPLESLVVVQLVRF